MHGGRPVAKVMGCLGYHGTRYEESYSFNVSTYYRRIGFSRGDDDADD